MLICLVNGALALNLDDAIDIDVDINDHAYDGDGDIRATAFDWGLPAEEEGSMVTVLTIES